MGASPTIKLRPATAEVVPALGVDEVDEDTLRAILVAEEGQRQLNAAEPPAPNADDEEQLYAAWCSHSFGPAYRKPEQPTSEEEALYAEVVVATSPRGWTAS